MSKSDSKAARPSFMVFRAALIKEMKEMDPDNYDNKYATKMASEKWAKMSDN